MAREFAPAICVNAVAPGVIAWPEGFTEKAKARQLAMVPAGRSGKISDVTEAIIFLLKSDYITGEVINVDGGRSI
jgi:NAD(P)-dependent dehydrogenase (short-subunit alcohol dehydrogenase family)